MRPLWDADRCVCGHTRDAHHDALHACLALRCDCRRYDRHAPVDASAAPPEPPTLRRLPEDGLPEPTWGDPSLPGWGL